MKNQVYQHINLLNDLPGPLSKVALSLIEKSLGKKSNKAIFNFAFINDIPKKIVQYKKQFKNTAGLLPPYSNMNYSLFF